MMHKTTLKELILTLLDSSEEIRLSNVAEAAGASKDKAADRRAIQRAFTELINEGKISAKGSARARSYIGTTVPTHKTELVKVKPDAFQGIPLTAPSKHILQHVSLPVKVRTPVGYQQNFLKKYVPNKTNYLSKPEKEKLWSLGQVEQQVRPAGTYARNILNRLLIDLSWNSSRLEGNTYSLLETKRLIELGQSAEGKDITEAQMILNHKGAIEYIVEIAGENKISTHDVRSIHGLLSEYLLGDPSASGRLREISVGISGTTYMPLDNLYLLQECFNMFIEKLNQIEDPFEQSLFSLAQLSYMQAFEDVNKRTARLVANIPLIKTNLRPLSFIDVEQEAYVKALLGVYEKTDISLLKDLYLWAYQRSSERYSAIQQNIGEPNALKLKYRTNIQEIIRRLIIEKIQGKDVVKNIQRMIQEQDIQEPEATELFKIIEIEVASLHDGNIARFKIRPSEFEDWKKL